MQERIRRYLREHINNRRVRTVAAALSLCTALGVFGALSMPAISAARQGMELDAPETEANWQQELVMNVQAAAEDNLEETWFVLRADGRNAGLSERYQFDENDMAVVPLTDGGKLQLYREFRDDGDVDYYFSLPRGTAADFDLLCAALEETGKVSDDDETLLTEEELKEKELKEKELKEKELKEKELKEKESKEKELKEKELKEKEQKEKELKEQELKAQEEKKKAEEAAAASSGKTSGTAGESTGGATQTGGTGSTEATGGEQGTGNAQTGGSTGTPDANAGAGAGNDGESTQTGGTQTGGGTGTPDAGIGAGTDGGAAGSTGTTTGDTGAGNTGTTGDAGTGGAGETTGDAGTDGAGETTGGSGTDGTSASGGETEPNGTESAGGAESGGTGTESNGAGDSAETVSGDANENMAVSDGEANDGGAEAEQGAAESAPAAAPAAENNSAPDTGDTVSAASESASPAETGQSAALSRAAFYGNLRTFLNRTLTFAPAALHRGGVPAAIEAKTAVATVEPMAVPSAQDDIDTAAGAGDETSASDGARSETEEAVPANPAEKETTDNSSSAPSQTDGKEKADDKAEVKENTENTTTEATTTTTPEPSEETSGAATTAKEAEQKDTPSTGKTAEVPAAGATEEAAAEAASAEEETDGEDEEKAKEEEEKEKADKEKPKKEHTVQKGNPAEDGGDLTLRWGVGGSLEEAKQNVRDEDAVRLKWLAGEERAAEEDSGIGKHDIRWIFASANSSYTDPEEQKNLVMTPAQRNEDAVVMAQIDFSLAGGEKPKQPGEIQIRVPAHLFTDRKGNLTGEFSTPLPSEAGTGSEKRFWSWYDENSDEIVFENDTVISEGYAVSLDVKYTYKPTLVKDGSIKELNAMFYLAEESEPWKSESTLTIRHKNYFQLLKSKKNGVKAFPRWNETWGEAPDDADAYFYVAWSYLFSIKTTEHVVLTMADSDFEEGKVVGGAQVSDFTIFNESYVDSKLTAWAEKGKLEFVYDSNSSFSVGDNKGEQAAAYLIVCKYPWKLIRDLGTDQTVKLKNRLRLNIDRKDHREVSQWEEAVKSVGPTDFEPPGKIFKLEKSERGYQRAAINLLKMGKDVKTEYTIDFHHKGYNDSVRRNISLIDNTMGFGGRTFSGDNWKPDDFAELVAGEDYYFTGATLYFRQADVKKNSVSGLREFINLPFNRYDEFSVTCSRAGGMIVEDITIPNLEPVGETEELGFEYHLTFPNETEAFTVFYSDRADYSQIKIVLHVTVCPTKNVLDAFSQFGNAALRDLPLYNYVDAKLFNSSNYNDFLSEREEGWVYFTQENREGGLRKQSWGREVDKVKQQFRTRYTVIASEGDYDDALAEIDPNNFTEGVFYDLLPLGTSVEDIRLQKTFHGDDIHSETIEITDFTAEIKDNWAGPGRNLLQIKYHEPTEMKGKKYRVILLQYTVVNSFENIFEHGYQEDNYVAYQSKCGSIADGKGDSYWTLADPPEDSPWKYFDDLDKSGDSPIGDTWYAESHTTIVEPLTADAGYAKYVKPLYGSYAMNNELVQEYGTTTPPKYMYKLLFRAYKDSSAEELIFYDVLENEIPDGIGEAYWQGKLESVHVEQAEKMGAAPKIYYSTFKGISPNGPDGKQITEHADLQNTKYWSTQTPDDMKTVTAVAIDLRERKGGGKFTLEPNQAVYVELLMEADVKNKDSFNKKYFDQKVYPLKAYNLSSCQLRLVKQMGGGPPVVIPSNKTTLALREQFSIQVKKVWEDDNAPKDSPIRNHNDDTVTVGLYNNSPFELLRIMTLNKDNEWKDTEKGLEAREEDNSKKDYDVLEAEVKGENLEGYRLPHIRLVKPNDDSVKAPLYEYEVTNKYDPETAGIVPLQVLKSDAKGDALEGAEFTLYQAEIIGDQSTGEGEWKKITPVAVGKTDEEGVLVFEKLQEGDYLLYETKAPEGYIRNELPFKLRVMKENHGGGNWDLKVCYKFPTAPGFLELHMVENKDYGWLHTTEFSNEPAYALPETGGHGTLPYTIGGTAILTAASLLYRYSRKKRRGEVKPPT